MLRFHLVTVPHSGTRFLNNLFFRLGFRNIQESTFSIIRKKENITKENSVDVEYKMNHWEEKQPNRIIHHPSFIVERPRKPVLTVLRHPYEIAISWQTRKTNGKGTYSNFGFDKLLRLWDGMICSCSMLNTIYFDISCPKEQRMAHMVGTLKALGVYEYVDKGILTEYVKEWKPVGATEGPLKMYYKQNKIPPPNLYNWERFDRAVKWYNEKLNECKYDNISS